MVSKLADIELVKLPVNDLLVGLLEGMLAEAKSGELQSVLFVRRYADGEKLPGHSGIENKEFAPLIAELQMMMFGLLAGNVRIFSDLKEIKGLLEIQSPILEI